MRTVKSWIFLFIFLFTISSGYKKDDNTSNDNPPIPHENAILINALKDSGSCWALKSKVTNYAENLAHQGKLLADYLRYQGFIVDELPRGITISSTILSR